MTTVANSKPAQKYTIFSIRLDPQTKLALESLAKAEERTRGDVIKRLIRQAAAKK